MSDKSKRLSLLRFLKNAAKLSASVLLMYGSVVALDSIDGDTDYEFYRIGGCSCNDPWICRGRCVKGIR